MKTLSFNQIPSIPCFGSLTPPATERYEDLREVELKYGITIRGCGWYKSGSLTLLLTRPNKIKREVIVEVWDRIDPRDMMIRLSRIEQQG
jgi:hypothetical protein